MSRRLDQTKAVANKGGDNFPGRQLAQARIVDPHRSDVDRNPRLDRDLNVLSAHLRKGFAVLDHTFDDQLHNFVDVLQRFFSRKPPSRCSLAFQCRAIGMPAIFIRFDDNFERVGLHDN